MHSLWIILILAALSPAHAQRVFSYDQPAPSSMPLPASIRTLLEHDPDVIDLLAGNDPALTTLPDDWVLCYRVFLGPAHETDYLIQANYPLGGANVTRFWVFRMIANQPRQVLSTGGLSLEIRSRKSNGLNEIRTNAVVTMKVDTLIYRFNGTQYIHTAEHIDPSPGR